MNAYFIFTTLRPGCGLQSSQGMSCNCVLMTLYGSVHAERLLCSHGHAAKPPEVLLAVFFLFTLKDSSQVKEQSFKLWAWGFMSLICTELKHTLGKYQLLCVWIAYGGKKWLKSRNIEFFDFMQVMLPPEWVVTARGLSQPHRKSAGSLSFESEQTHCFTTKKKKNS